MLSVKILFEKLYTETNGVLHSVILAKETFNFGPPSIVYIYEYATNHLCNPSGNARVGNYGACITVAIDTL